MTEFVKTGRTRKVSSLFGRDMDLGLDADWAYQAIKQVGNHGEIYERHLGPIDLVRASSLNDSYLDGSLIYAPPIR